jgi:hypothetical protein
MSSHIGNIALDVNDPKFFLKYLNVNSINRISDMDSENRNSRDNVIIFVFSIILGIIANIFTNKEIWWVVTGLSDLLLALLIWKVYTYNKNKKVLRKMVKPLIKTSEDLGSQFPGIKSTDF